MEPFEKNLAALLEREVSASTIASLREAPPMETAPTAREGRPTAFARRGARRVALHSARDPVREAEKWVGSFAVDTARAAALAGFGLGYAAEEILRRPNIETLIVIEPNIAHFATALRLRDLSALVADPRVEWFVGPFREMGTALSGALNRVAGDAKDDSVAVMVHPPSLQTMPESESELRDVLSYLRDTRRMSRGVFSEKIAVNAKANEAALNASPPVSRLYGRFAGVPAVIIVPGPSLGKALPLLPRAGNHAMTVALDSALLPLLKTGAPPDFVVTVDPQPAVAMYFPPSPPPQTRLVFFPGSFPDVVLRFGDNRRFAAAKSPAPDPDALLLSGSVLSAAVDFCMRAGCDPITLVGADLAVKPHRTHVDGSPANAPPQTHKGRTCEGYFGLDVATTESFYMYLRNTEELLASRYAGRRIWDATEGGARIAGTERVSFREALVRIADAPRPDIETLCAEIES